MLGLRKTKVTPILTIISEQISIFYFSARTNGRKL